ncbi:hypothetical protein NDU88_000408 [Pleurodeles waltl]|uniref:Transposase n=1 Tax=Pleurodeles waltl TaxID=8319 RepID=A0AAV7VUL7_PLEWA|nr:hypothetical protein NDU88_000408 [Pleurodeles waltl]
MKALLLTMQSSLSSIDGKMDTMTTRLDLLTAGLEKHSGRITEAEQRISNGEDVMQKRQEQLSQMDKLLKVIALKNEDLEARSRRNNIGIVGIPESTNTGRMEQFVDRLLFKLFGEDAFSRLLIVERAHRTLMARPPPGAPPRPIVTRLLNYRDTDTTLRLSRERQPLKFEGSVLSIYPNFMTTVQEARKKFTIVKQKLRQLNIQYAMLYQQD